MKFTKITALVGLLATLPFAASAQDDLGKQLSKVAGQNAVSYLSPLLSAWGADLNSGFYHTADLHDILGFDVGVKVGAVMVKDADRVFDLVLPDKIVYDGPLGRFTLNPDKDYDKVIPGAPTALGDANGIAVKVKTTSPIIPLRGQTIFTTPGGFNLKYCTVGDASSVNRVAFWAGGCRKVRPNVEVAGRYRKVQLHRTGCPAQHRPVHSGDPD